MMNNDKIAFLSDKLFEKLKEKNVSVATAESCTGGMIGQCLTSIAGISAYYGYGFITYSNEAKMKLLGVKEETLASHGAVSSQTVIEMAKGALEVSGADIAVSVSGIAGPGGGSKEKPVGLVYVGVALKDGKAFSEKLNLTGDRQTVREKTVCNVFELIIENI